MPEWKETYSAQLGPFALDIQDIEDAFEKSIVKHEFPYRDGALLEDMGQKARTIKFRCFFMNETYLLHYDLINYLESKDLFELVHPKYGLIQGAVETMNVRHDDRLETAEIDITFIENLRGKAEPLPYVQVEKSIEEAVASGQEEQMEFFEEAVISELGPEGMDIVAEELVPEEGILEQFTGLSPAGRAYIKRVDAYVRTLEAELIEIANPANGLISAIDYGTNLPGRVIGALARTVERYAVLYNTAGNAPTRFLSSLDAGLTELDESIGDFSEQTRMAGAQRLALEAAYAYQEDEGTYNNLKRIEGQKSFDEEGNYIGSPVGQCMSVNDLESTLALVRAALQESIETGRANNTELQSLKDMALALLTHVNKIKVEREKITEVEIDNELPLHLICLKYGLPYNTAERLLLINGVKQPSFVKGAVKIYAR